MNKSKIINKENSGTGGDELGDTVKADFGGKVTVCVLLHPLGSPKNTYGYGYGIIVLFRPICPIIASTSMSVAAPLEIMGPKACDPSTAMGIVVKLARVWTG